MNADTITKVQYYLAPVAAPVPTAVAVGASLNHSLGLIPGIDPSLALAGAVAGAVATELSGGLMLSMAARAFFRRRWGPFLVALAGSAAYIAVVAYSVSSSHDALPIIGSVVVAGLVYVAVAVYQLLALDEQRERDQAKKAETDRIRQAAEAREAEERALRLAEHEVELERQRAAIEQARLEAEAARNHQERLLENARLRAIRFGAQPAPVRSVRRTSEQSGLRPDWLQKTREFLAANPNATTRDIAAHLGASSSSTGKTYRDAVLAEGQQ